MEMGLFRSDEEIAARKREEEDRRKHEEIERRRQRDMTLEESGLAFGEYSDEYLDELLREDLLVMYDEYPGVSATMGLTLTGNHGASETVRSLRNLMRQNIILMRQNEQIIRELRKIVNKN